MFQLQHTVPRLRRVPRDLEAAWLSKLVDQFEETSRNDIRAVPCDEGVLAGLRDQLAWPALPRPGVPSGSPALLWSGDC